MTKRRSRGSLLLPLALVFLGVMFLLVNLGVIDRTIWSEIVRYWPVLLILIGIDGLVRRSSVGIAFGTVAGAAVLISAGFVLFHLFAPEAWITERHAFSYPLGGTTAAEVVLSCRDCSMEIGAQSALSDSDNLISGALTLRRNEHLTETVREDGGKTQFRLESDYRLLFLSSEREGHNWEVDLNESIPLSLSLATDGVVNLDLTSILIESADVSTGDDLCTVSLSLVSDATVYLSGSRIEVLVPASIGVRITGSASMELTVPSDYVRTENATLSSNYESAPYRTDIVLRPGAEWIEIKPAAEDTSSDAS